DISPDEVHEIGTTEIERIDEERRAIARTEGFGDHVNRYRAALEVDPANTPKSKEELLARAREDIERAMALAPRYFGRLPKAACGRDGALPLGGRAVRHARRAGLARRSARRRLRDARAALGSPAIDRFPAQCGPVRNRCGYRDGPLHRVARPGAHLQAGAARNRTIARSDRGSGRRHVRSAGIPRPGAWPWVPAARDARPRTSDMGRNRRLT